MGIGFKYNINQDKPGKKSQLVIWDAEEEEVPKSNSYYRYGNHYSGTGRRKSYSSGYSYYDDYDYYDYKKSNNSAWGSWGYSWYEEDNKDIMIKTHPNYDVPKRHDLGIASYEKDKEQFAKDLCKFFFYKMIDDKNYLTEKYADETKLSANHLEEFLNHKSRYDLLWNTAIPGFSPKEKALYVMAVGRKNGKCISRIEDLNEKNIASLRMTNDDYSDPILNELYDILDYEKNLTSNKLKVLKYISMIKDFNSNFKIEKEITSKYVENSKINKQILMKEYSQLSKIELYQRLMPNYKQKLYLKDLIINSPISKTEHKQKLIILLDFSGSMSNVSKQEWVIAILMDRLKYAIKEECEIFFSKYCRGLEGGFYHIYDRESAIKFWKSFSTRPNGGDTNIGQVVSDVAIEINENNFFGTGVNLKEDKPEILIICDGQDDPKRETFNYKTNILSLENHNVLMKKFAQGSGGSYYDINAFEIEKHENLKKVKT